MRTTGSAAALALALLLAAPGGVESGGPAPFSWEHRLRGDAIVLLGEVHDNPAQQRLRLEILRRAFAAGWRPAIAMEQFDREHQADIDRARRERPHDAAHLIEEAAPGRGRPGGGWNWEYYRPYVALALEYDVPLLAANLSRADAEKIVEHGYSAVFSVEASHALGLDRAPSVLLAAQEREIDSGHCQALPKELLPGMGRAQLARDAVMASVLRGHAARGVVLLAGDGHVRRDIGVPKWLEDAMHARVLAVGFLERGDRRPPASAFDAVVRTAAAARPDPCSSLERRRSHRTPEQPR